MLYNTSMRLLAESTESTLLTTILASIAGVVFVALVLLFFISNHNSKKHFNNIQNMSKTLRVYVVDVKNDKVSYFNSSFLKQRKTSSITTFYNQFRLKEREELINWIGELLEGDEKTTKFLEIKVYLHNQKQDVSSILEVQKIDYKKQIIYLESHILQNEEKGKKKNEQALFSKKDYLSRKIALSGGKGYTFGFNFFNVLTKTDDLSQVIYADMKNIIGSFASDSVIVTEHSFGKIIVSNISLNEKVDAFSFLTLIKTKLNKALLIKSYADDIDYTIGVIENDHSPDVNVLIKNVIAVSEHAKDEEEHTIFFNDIKNIVTKEQGQQYRTDVEQIIQDNKLIYYFQPIYSVDRNRIVAYRSSVVPVDSYFKNIDDLKNYAIRTEDDKELFSTIVKNTISRFIQEKNDYSVKLILPISINELNYVNRSLGHIIGVSDANIVLLLKERELVALPEEFGEEGLINSILSFKSKGYAVALEIDDDILTLSPNLYKVFDYFNLSVATHISKKNAGAKLPSFQGLIEQLLHYKTPIVASDITSFDIVELVYKLGVDLICSDAIALPAENIMPISRKIVTKIQNLKS